MNNINTTCGCDKSRQNISCDCNKKNANNMPCSGDGHMTTPCQKELVSSCKCNVTPCSEDNCNYCVNEDSIFFPDIESKVASFQLKDVWTELSINGSVAVPMQKPSIEQVDSVNATVQILSRRVVVAPAVYDNSGIVIETVTNEEGKITTGRKLVIEGLICVANSYVSLNKDQSVHSFHGQVPFSAFIVLPKDADVDANYEVYSLIEEICVKQVCDRSINFTFAIILTAEKTSNTDCSKSYYDNSGIDCMGSIGPCGQSECFTDQPVIKGPCTRIQVENLIKDNTETLWTEISVPELLTIPACKPDVMQILTVTSSVEVMCQKVIITPQAATNYEGLELSGLKLLVHAVLRQRVTYISTTDCKSVHSAHFDVPVSAYIVLPNGTSPLSKYKIRTCIEDLYACALNERQIFKNTTLFIKAEPIACL
ncbi:MAG: DUF3794 domain-containing protein [Clostridium sp.]|uniref:DUF3794 domain-containing protein n=1 Tax=Clostridium sp. TaxID=1506 RepID=UPI00305956F3